MKRYLLLAIAAAIVLAGCEESSRPVASGKGRIRAIHAIPTAPNYGFFIEERFQEFIDYKTASSTNEWDDLEYNFNFDILLAGETERSRVAIVPIDVVKDRDYTIFLSGAVDAPDVTVWETDIRVWEDTDTTYEIRIANMSPSLGPVDVYFDAPGTAPVAGNQVGTLDFSEILPAQEYPAGTRRLILTPVNDPGTILYESVDLLLTERVSYILGPFDQDANDIGPVPVILMNAVAGGGGSIADVNVQSTARFFHTSQNMGNADIYVDDPLTVPIITNHAFRDVTGDIPVAAGDVPVTYTAAGNMGSILIDTDRTFNANRHHSLFALRNSDGEDVLTNFVLDRRSVETQSRLSMVNTSENHRLVDVYVVGTGDSIDEAVPLIPALGTSAPPFSSPLFVEQYDVYVTPLLDKTILAGPIPLDAQAGTVFESVIYDTVDPNVVDLVFIPLP